MGRPKEVGGLELSSFCFSEAHEMFRKEVRAFSRKELAPGAKERARLDHYPKEMVRKIGKQGLYGVNLPEEYGGQPADWVSVGIVAEELARVDFSGAVLLHHAEGSCLTLAQGPKAMQVEWAPPIIAGEKIAAFLVTEPDHGSDAAAMETRAIRDGDDYVITGEKTAITYGLQADMGLLWAKTDPSQKAHGVTCFLLPLDLPGITKSRFPDLGWRQTGRASIILDNVRLPARYRIGEEGQGFYSVMGAFDLIRVLLCLEAIGMAAASLDDAIAYAKQRTAFGQPVAKFEGVSFTLAEDYTMLEAARLLCYRTLSLRDQGVRHTKESAMCKLLCPKVAAEIQHHVLLLHGHIGYTEDYPVEQRLRDTIGLEIGDGTAQIMKIIVARELLGREFLPY
ncbi:MAG: acyl-CoA dehydrogenase family protein [Dehalococcoidia bacterium]|nr:acyl-CoA dehydrogenase family protein [Dehalococcoidia bacterium]